MPKPTYQAFAACLVLMMAAGGCASARKIASHPQKTAGEQTGPEDRLMIKKASIAVTVAAAKIDEAVAAVGVMVRQQNGYVTHTQVADESRAYVALRVPSGRLESTLDELGKLGKETGRRITSEDVTAQVRDQENVLKSKQALRDRLRKLLEMAKSVQDVIAVEEQLTRLQAEIDALERRLKRAKNDVDYSEIELDLSRETIYGPLGYIGYGVWWVLAKLFVIR